MAAKLFLGGLAATTQREDVEQHFCSYGTVIDAVVMFKDGRPRGFGFVTFAEQEAMDAVLAEPQIIHERQVDVKPAVAPDEAPPPRTGGGGGGGGGCGCGGAGPYGGHNGGAGPSYGRPPPGGGAFAYGGPAGGPAGGYGGYGLPPRSGAPALPAKGPPKGAPKGGGKGGHQGATDKVFVGGLSPITTDDSLNAYFSRYGTLVDVVVMKDSATQKSRGFGFVRFDSMEPVDYVMNDYSMHELDGKWVEVKRAVPQEQMGGGGPPRGAPMGGKGMPPMMGKGCFPPPGPGYGYAPAYDPYGGGGGGAYVAAARGGMRARPY